MHDEILTNRTHPRRVGPRLPRFPVCVAAVLALLPAVPMLATSFFGANHTEIIVVVDFTEAGRKITPPTREQPAFYFPVIAGYRAEGETMGGQKQPPPNLAPELLAKALAAQHYFVTGPNAGRPSLLLIFHWGYMNPEFMTVPTMMRDSRLDPPDAVKELQVLMNEKAMSGLVLGNSMNRESLEGDPEREELMRAVQQDRYFVTVSAYDFASAKKKNYLLLWQAKMSMPSNRVSLEQVLPAMIATGAPHFGRETRRPQRIPAPVRAGNVEVGPLIVVPDTPPDNKNAPGKK